MDPLSVAASIIGLLQATQSISNIITRLTSCKKNARKEILEIKSSVDTIRLALSQLQQILLRRANLDQKRTALILVDQIVVTLSACVTIFSDLDGFVHGLVSDERLGLLDSIRWEFKAPEVRKHMEKLETQKTSLTLMITVLTCDSTHTAQDSATELVALMKQVLESHDILLTRLSASESTLSMSVSNSNNLNGSICPSTSKKGAMQGNANANTSPDTESSSIISQNTIRGTSKQEIKSQNTLKTTYGPLELETASIFTSAVEQHGPHTGSYFDQSTDVQDTSIIYTFEDELRKSRVYHRAIVRGPDTFSISIAISSERTASWSMLSGLSLSKITNIGIQALPIYSGDLSNSDFYTFGEFDPLSRCKISIFGIALAMIPPAAIVGIKLGSDRIYYLPFVILECAEYIGRLCSRDARSDVFDTLFILEGDSCAVNELQKEFDSVLEGVVDPTDPLGVKDILRNVREAKNSGDAHDVAMCLGRYLSMLPEPVIPFKFFTLFMNSASAKDLGCWIYLILLLPRITQDVLLYVVLMIGEIATPATLLELVLTFRPLLLRENTASVNSLEKEELEHKSVKILLFMVVNARELIRRMNVTLDRKTLKM